MFLSASADQVQAYCFCTVTVSFDSLNDNASHLFLGGFMAINWLPVELTKLNCEASSSEQLISLSTKIQGIYSIAMYKSIFCIWFVCLRGIKQNYLYIFTLHIFRVIVMVK